MKDVTINVASVVEGGICVAGDDGHKVHDTIIAEFNQDNRVILSFRGVTRVTTLFLNAAVGQLYGEYPENYLRGHFSPAEEAEDWHLNRLKTVVDQAKRFFANPDATLTSYRRHVGIEDEQGN
jgi:STAS-like domain of unknown function (DUF4325)